jgi:septum formation protein
MKKIVLASASPRRRELLELIGLVFEVDPGNAAEDLDPELSPHELAKTISLQKALEVARKHVNAIVIAADTFIVFQGRIIGKPATEAGAKEILTTLCGTSHSVITGFTVLDTGDNRTVSRAIETIVHMKQLTPDEIDAYIRTKEPMDKAGAYAIQGTGSLIVDRIEGDYFNVIGLPLSALAECLKQFGIKVL